MPLRVGIGYDIHRRGQGRLLVLGGVRFRTDWGLEGHSDADVLSHAIGDALLGAAALATFCQSSSVFGAISSMPVGVDFVPTAS